MKLHHQPEKLSAPLRQLFTSKGSFAFIGGDSQAPFTRRRHRVKTQNFVVLENSHVHQGYGQLFFTVVLESHRQLLVRRVNYSVSGQIIFKRPRTTVNLICTNLH